MIYLFILFVAKFLCKSQSNLMVEWNGLMFKYETGLTFKGVTVKFG